MKKKGIIVVLFAVSIFLTACGDITSNDLEGERTVLTLGTVSANQDLREQVEIFNQQNSAYLIEIKTYGDMTVAGTDAVDLMQMEIAAGKGPDIIDFGYLYSPRAVCKGITEELSAYMEADKEFHKEDYFMNVVEALAGDDKIYVISPQFSIRSVAGRKEDLGDATNWNMQDVMSYFQGNDQEKILFPGDSRREVFGFLCMGSMGEFVNWADGTCSFDEGEFKELLTFADQFPDQRIYDEDYSVLQQFQVGKALLYPVSIRNVYECAKVRMIFDNVPINYIGYPLNGRNGNIAQMGNLVLGINKNSDYKEIAWKFIKGFLQEEYQSSIENGLPLLKSELERRLDEAKKIEYEQDMSGREVEKVKDSIIFEGEDPIDIVCINEQDAVDLLEIINNVDTAYAVDLDLYSIILEEVTYYFEDNRNMDSVIEIIQNRASIYVSENY